MNETRIQLKQSEQDVIDEIITKFDQMKVVK